MGSKPRYLNQRLAKYEGALEFIGIHYYHRYRFLNTRTHTHEGWRAHPHAHAHTLTCRMPQFLAFAIRYTSIWLQTDVETLTVCVLFFIVDSIPDKDVHVSPVTSALRLLCFECPKLVMFPPLIRSLGLKCLKPFPCIPPARYSASGKSLASSGKTTPKAKMQYIENMFIMLFNFSLKIYETHFSDSKIRFSQHMPPH